MREKELSICIAIHHIATFLGIWEGIYYLAKGRQNLFRSCVIFLLTAFQSWAGLKILVDLQTGRSRLKESYRSLDNLDKLKSNSERKRSFLWGLVLSSAIFKVVPVRLLGR